MYEEKYRPRYLASDIRQAYFCIELFLLFVGIMAVRDYNFYGLTSPFYWLIVLRVAIIGFGLLLVAFVRKLTDFRTFDKVLAIAFFAAINAVFIIDITRPGDYGLYLLVDLAALSAIYVAVPMRLRNQLALGLYFMIGDVIIFALTKDAAMQSYLYTIIPAFALVNVTGYTLSRLLNTSRCRETMALEAEAKANDEKDQIELEQRKHEKLEAIGQAAGGIAHDFNNIFTAILGNVSLAREMAAPGSEMAKVLVEAEKASLRATELNRQLITFSKGGHPLKQPTYVVDLVRNTVKSVLDGSKIEAKVTIPEVMIAEMDPIQMSQALKNILVNAKDAMPDGGAVRIGARSIDKIEVCRRGLSGLLNGDHYVAVDISDDGPGIAEKDRDKIFQPFYSTKPGASGLGLAAAYSICKSHGGYLTLGHNGSKGATFSMYLPAGITSLGLKEAVTKVAKHSRILVMDDEEGVRKVAGKMLVRTGYDVETAVDGREAIELYREALESGNRFEAVILDMTVPGGMGGLETIGILRDIDPAVKAIVSSGYSDDPALSKYDELGFIGVVHKPYTMDQLRDALAQVLG